MINLPNILSLVRIIFVPVMAFFAFSDDYWAMWAWLGIYSVAGLTDFLDGYLAREMGEVSALGRVLDPIADKVLVVSVMLLLAMDDRLGWINVLPCVVIIIREFLISALREVLAEYKLLVRVSIAAKWKTTCQMGALGFLIAGQDAPLDIPAFWIGTLLIWAAAILTVSTAWEYVRNGLGMLLGDKPRQSK